MRKPIALLPERQYLSEIEFSLCNKIITQSEIDKINSDIPRNKELLKSMGIEILNELIPVDDFHDMMMGHIQQLHNVTIQGYVKDRTIYLNESFLESKYSQSIRNHSPDGFSWGYNGSGCSQLSLAILLELLPKELALLYYQDFRSLILSKLNIDQNFKIDINLIDVINSIEIIRKRK